MIRALALLVALLLAPLTAAAQENATLVADSVGLSGDDTLTASGGVEIWYRGTKLTASRVTYSRSGDRLELVGPLQIVERGPDGTVKTLLLASSADLSADLREGVLRSARMVLDEQLQLAALQITRINGRYTELAKVTASFCEVCPSNPVPLWEVRARRVLHDQEARQLYFEGAQLRLAGVPVAYLPRLRLPDPTLKRAAGFLVPELLSSNKIGLGLRVPYFLPLGPSRDLTFSPLLTTQGTKSLGLRYRQAFANGALTLNGSLTDDNLRAGPARYHLFGRGDFALPRGFHMSADLRAVSDGDYLTDYGISTEDRLRSGVTVTRTRPDEHISGAFTLYSTLRPGEGWSQLPSVLLDTTWRKRFPLAGGSAGVRFDVHGHWRASSADSLGRDVARATLGADWRRSWVLPAGLVGAAMADLRADVYSIKDDAAYPGTRTRITPAMALELRWPWMRPAQRAGGAVQIIEPIAQLAWSPPTDATVPNEDSPLAEFDEGNLFSFSRFPGAERHEGGLRANLGLSWQRHAASGWTLGLLAGKVVRGADASEFSAGSGLQGLTSDTLLVAHLSTKEGWSLTERALVDGDRITRNELRFAWAGAGGSLGGSYLWLEADPLAARMTESHELVVSGTARLTEHWTGRANAQYDIASRRAPDLGLGLQFRNECATADLSLSRRLPSSASVAPTTTIGLSVSLTGFGSGSSGGTARCLR